MVPLQFLSIPYLYCNFSCSYLVVWHCVFKIEIASRLNEYKDSRAVTQRRFIAEAYLLSLEVVNSLYSHKSDFFKVKFNCIISVYRYFRNGCHSYHLFIFSVRIGRKAPWLSMPNWLHLTYHRLLLILIILYVELDGKHTWIFTIFSQILQISKFFVWFFASFNNIVINKQLAHSTCAYIQKLLTTNLIWAVY